MSKGKVEVTDFENRGTKEHPYGFINFDDGMRIGYSPGSNGTNEDGLFNCQQPDNMRHRELRAAHITAATKFVREHLKNIKTVTVYSDQDDNEFVGECDPSDPNDWCNQ